MPQQVARPRTPRPKPPGPIAALLRRVTSCAGSGVGVAPLMSAFRGRADVVCQGLSGPFLAKRRHSSLFTAHEFCPGDPLISRQRETQPGAPYAMLEKGSVDGQQVWKRVLAAVKEIQREEPREGEAVN